VSVEEPVSSASTSTAFKLHSLAKSSSIELQDWTLPKSASGTRISGGGGLGGLGCFGGNTLLLPLGLGLGFGGLPFLLPGRGGLCADNADVEVGVDVDPIPGEVERELGDDRDGSKEAIEESRSLDGIFDWDPVDGSW
jgi:hypothetical protein